MDNFHSPFTNKIINERILLRSSGTPETICSLRPLIASIQELIAPRTGSRNRNEFQKQRYSYRSKKHQLPIEYINSFLHCKLHKNIDLRKTTYKSTEHIASNIKDSNVVSEPMISNYKRKQYCRSVVGHHCYEFSFGKDESAESKHCIGLKSLIRDNVSAYYLITGTRKASERKAVAPMPMPKKQTIDAHTILTCKRRGDEMENEMYNFIESPKKIDKSIHQIRLRRYKNIV
jgi:hypothetical protein